MIVREREDDFILIKQDDHAFISGEIAKHFEPSIFIQEKYRDDLLLAIYEHDRCWISLDNYPLWNEEQQQPYSFDDYPALPKLKHYEQGIAEVEALNAYAGLICSIHFAKFYKGVQDIYSQQFFEREKNRQQRLMAELKGDSSIVDVHYQILQLCDGLSLYLCLNEPGVTKEKEHPWYKEGFANSHIFDVKQGQKISARWLSTEEVAIQGAPFISSFSVHIKYKSVSKQQVARSGLKQAYLLAKEQEHQVLLMK